ncbi:hypothetical protein Ciccas_005996 [Cichlidogyrus casuarinus]|uniref:MICOS complex subunit n=1 Tax=Cichlidogyrus casuarinus TaxID=1844966 RepID=A0ABD2Q733_9PLAT
MEREGAVKNTILETQNLYDQLKNNNEWMAKFGFISFCGLGGMILGFRGGKIRKFSYGLIGTSLGSLITYPTQTLHLGECGFKKAQESSSDLYKYIEDSFKK